MSSAPQDEGPLRLAVEDAGDRSAWEAAAAGVLRKSRRMTEDDPDADVWAVLTRTTLDGIEVEAAEDRLGFLNFSTVGVPVPEWRVNSYAAYSFDRHTIRGQLNYVSAVQDERTGVQYGENGEDWYSLNLYYLFDVTDDMRLSLSIENIEDRDPPPAQIELGYDPRAGGNALGRTIELGLKKTF